MAYLALARKWRPKAFSEVVGQKHVVQALSNALDSGRVHHAFLFTGTRGVGKTTLARIFAKSLNCEEGTSAEPCQVCSTCKSIDEGRYVDLIEIDAASNTKVDDTRELLDNVQYAPTTGNYKVYLMDEVHMLSGHSFNALLKTLEEPPGHVKFLFATTDPQKLPVTILSRCLQFNLRAMRPEQVERQLIKILNAENISFDEAAIDAISSAADGSMRDGLSLLDQAIALGGGEVRTQAVQGMLGTIKAEFTEKLLHAIVEQDVDSALSVVAEMADSAVDFEVAIDELLVQLYHLSLALVAPASLESATKNHNLIKGLASKTNPETLQLFYQIGLISKRDISLAPNLRVGFEMALLRMFAFEPKDQKPSEVPAIPLQTGDGSGLAEKKTPQQTHGEPTNEAPPAALASSLPQDQDPVVAKGEPINAQSNHEEGLPSSDKPNESSGVPDSLGNAGPPLSAYEDVPSSVRIDEAGEGAQSFPTHASPDIQNPDQLNVPTRGGPTPIVSSPEVLADQRLASGAAEPVTADVANGHQGGLSPIAITLAGNNEWGELVEQTSLAGMTKELAMNCAAERISEDRIDLCLSPKLQHLYNDDRFNDIKDAVKAVINNGVDVSMEIDDSDRETPSECLSRLGFERDEQVRETMHSDPTVKSIISEFDATIKENSIKPIT